MPEETDIWQAASLLVGLYGSKALDVAAERLSELEEEESTDRQVWDRIIVKVNELLCSGPALQRH